MERPEYITCIKHVGKKNKSWCGKNISIKFAFENIDHAIGSVESHSRLTICPECWTKWHDELDRICEEYK